MLLLKTNWFDDMLILKYKSKCGSSLNESQTGNPIWVKSDGTVVDIDTVVMVVEAVMQDLAQYFPSVERIMKHKDIVYTDSPYVPTMATDGVSIFINPAFAEYLINKDEEKGPLYLEFVLIHEALHILFDHCNKHSESLDKYSDSEKVNMAQDYEINYTIENFLRQGPGNSPFKGVTNAIDGCYNDDYGKKGLTWEEIYDKIPKIVRKKKLAKTSDEWKRGFSDGFAEVINQLRKESLVEKCVMM